MKDRLITLLGALVALTVVYLLFLQRPPEPPVTRPLSMEPGRNGYLALGRWLQSEGVAVASLQERFDRLAAEDSGFAARGNVLITTMPHVSAVRGSERLPLAEWIREGNTLLVLAALDDTPEWSSPVGGANFLPELTGLTGLLFRQYRGTAQDDVGDDPGLVPAETAVEIEPALAHPLMAGVTSLRGFSDAPSALWSVESAAPFRLTLRVGVERSTGIDALWQLPRDAGQVILVASGTVLANHNIGASDAREFVANLLERHLAADGTVIFDDMHQGVSRLYDAAALFRDPRLRYSAAFVLAAWLIYLLGSSNRFAPPLLAQTSPRQGDFLRAAGGFMARRLDRRAAGLLLFEEWFGEVRRARSLPQQAQPPWPELQATPTLPRSTYEELHASYERLTNGRTVNLPRLHNTLKPAREAIG
jgi:hypothetical protein